MDTLQSNTAHLDLLSGDMFGPNECVDNKLTGFCLLIGLKGMGYQEMYSLCIKAEEPGQLYYRLDTITLFEHRAV